MSKTKIAGLSTGLNSSCREAETLVTGSVHFETLKKMSLLCRAGKRGGNAKSLGQDLSLPWPRCSWWRLPGAIREMATGKKPPMLILKLISEPGLRGFKNVGLYMIPNRTRIRRGG